MNWKKMFNEQRPSDIYNVRLPVTWTDRILEFIAFLLLIAMWVLAAFLLRLSEGSDVALHIRLDGEVDNVSDSSSLIIITVAWTFVMFLLAFSAYRPRLINPSTRITTLKQLKLVVTQVRGMNILLGVMGICLLLSMIYETILWVIIPTCMLLVEVLVFSILIRRVGK